MLQKVPFWGYPMTKKLILPAEVKVCATCSYWDGDRHIDTEMSLVVVSDECAGECIAMQTDIHGLTDVRGITNCLWEHIGPDDMPEKDEVQAQNTKHDRNSPSM